MERDVAFPDDAGGDFQVVIEATMPDRTGSSIAGDIAIDDVFVTPFYKCSSPTGMMNFCRMLSCGCMLATD